MPPFIQRGMFTRQHAVGAPASARPQAETRQKPARVTPGDCVSVDRLAQTSCRAGRCKTGCLAGSLQDRGKPPSTTTCIAAAATQNKQRTSVAGAVEVCGHGQALERLGQAVELALRILQPFANALLADAAGEELGIILRHRHNRLAQLLAAGTWGQVARMALAYEATSAQSLACWPVGRKLRLAEEGLCIPQGNSCPAHLSVMMASTLHMKGMTILVASLTLAMGPPNSAWLKKSIWLTWCL